MTLPILVGLALGGWGAPGVEADCFSANPQIMVSGSFSGDQTYIWTADVFAANPAVTPGYYYFYDVVPPVTSAFLSSSFPKLMVLVPVVAGEGYPVAGIRLRRSLLHRRSV